MSAIITQRGFTGVLLLFLGSLITGILIFLYFFNKPSLPAKFIPPASRDAKEEVASKIYNDKRISFSYPNGLEVKKDTESDFAKRHNGDVRKNFSGYVQYQPPDFVDALFVVDKNTTAETAPFTVWVFDNPHKLPAELWFDNFWYYPFLWGVFSYPEKPNIAPKNEASISGQSVKFVQVLHQTGKPKYYLISREERMLLIRLIESKEGIGEKILDSLKIN